MNYLFLCDSPTLNSGFAQVTKNLLPHLDLPNKHVWSLGYYGEAHPYQGVNLYPANVNCSWEHPQSIGRFFDWLFSFQGESTLWTLHDPFRLRAFVNGLNRFKSKGGKLISYVPVDSPLQLADKPVIELMDVCVAYSQYGKREILKICPDKHVYVIPHGYDERFITIDNARESIFPDIPKDKILVGNVNSNTERKALHRSIQVLAELNKIEDRFLLYIHANPRGFFNLKELAYQQGVLDKMIFADQFYGEGTRNGLNTCPSELLNVIYNSFDLFLSTTYGEGWGLTVSEAATCNIPIAIPRNTVFPEIYKNPIWLETNHTAIYNGNIVPDISPKQAAKTICEADLDSINCGEDVKKYKWENIVKSWNHLILKS